ncbi:MAG TPA: VCBS repeat-containing protein [Kofleriaceae bacterium]|nr:VCBS repeat-containing protein [Kofleriaceae bacterium]
MVRALAVAAVLLTGCFDNVYHCTKDEQCDVGAAGRCELDGFCTHFDPTCSTARRYSDHAGVLTNQCYDDRVVPINACAGGQAPAAPEGCFADVCARLPACCNTGWTDACVQVAQEACPTLKCDTRIAVNAKRDATPGTSDRFELIWDGAAWTNVPKPGLGAPLAWIGPKPGDGAPRLVSTMQNVLVVDGVSPMRPTPPDQTYNAITSVDFDRDGRDTVVAAFSTSTSNGYEIWKVGTESFRVVNGASERLSWGDDNRDGYPDAIAANANTAYAFVDNIDGDGHIRTLAGQATANTTGGVTPGAPGIRSIDWMDFDGDTNLDLVVFGASIRIHTKPDDLNDTAQFDLDCDPPSTLRSCMSAPEPDLEQIAFVGAALPSATDPAIIAASYPGRQLYRIENPAVPAGVFPFPNDQCVCPKTPTGCTGNQCTGYDCNACQPVLAVIVRDLDADHLLDIVAIDAKLRVYVGLAKDGYAFGTAMPLISPLPTLYTSIDVSVSGAVIP